MLPPLELLVYQILEGIFKLIESESEHQIDVKVRRKAFMLLMLLIMNDRMKKLVYDYISFDDKVATLSSLLQQKYKFLENEIRK